MMGLGKEFGHERRASHVHSGAFRVIVRHRFFCFLPQPIHFCFVADHWVKIVSIDNQELMVKDAIRYTISGDMEVLEVDSAKEVIIIPMKQIKYLACDATVFATKKPS